MVRDTEALTQRINEAIAILQALGFPPAQSNERSALTLLALLALKPTDPWSQARNPLMGITPIMEFMAAHYDKKYAPNTRETVRRQTIHQFLEAGFIIQNPDDPTRATNSGKNVYQIDINALALLRSYGTPAWEDNLLLYLSKRATLKDIYAQARRMARLPVSLPDGNIITLHPGGQNLLIKQIIEQFGPLFTPGGKVIYIGDANEKFACYDEDAFSRMGLAVDLHGKIPDVIIEYPEKSWVVLIEAVTSHGPIDPKRRGELRQLFHAIKERLVFVTAFSSRKAMREFIDQISWETEVWVAEAPTHLIHFNGERFLGPYEV